MAKKQVMTFTADLRKSRQIRQASPKKRDEFGRSVVTEMTTDIKLSFGESPSSPGDPPGVDTGALRASIHSEKVGTAAWEIMDGVEYGIMHEFGTVHLPPRPWMVPVFMSWEREILTYAKAFNWID